MFSISGQIFDQKPSHIIPLLFLLGLAWIVAKTLYLAFFSPLRHVPGPTLAKITRLWELWTLRQGSFHSKLVELHSKHGPVVRIAPNRYSFDATADLKKIYSSTADFPKSEFYHAWRPPGEENLLTFRNKKDHASRKRPIAQLYSMTHLRNYEEAVDKMNAVLLEKLDQYGRSGELVDLPDISQLYALDVIGYITMGESFNVLERGRKGNVLLQKIENNPKYSVQAGLFPELHPWFYYLTKPFATPTARITADTATTKIQEFRNGGISSDESLGFESFLSKLIRMEDAGKVDSLSSFDAVGSNIFAGSDTTGITLSAAFYLLYTNPEKLRKLRDEMDEAAQNGALSQMATFAETKTLSYLQAVIKEVLRMHPPVSVILPREVPHGGAELGGYFFPEKVMMRPLTIQIEIS
ncbi:hypothetical protein QQS21_005220 [Conoideocrella luteorostrata]|uniref:Cytochrome P450 n=1 Tax=Conoideocrella luteorostrata TaxID=1105319 RepID=A0AAJ0CQ28_9HYPO|nr:hypothetical protein QQS21_005220 [Conoideocrella luteorostrata]